MAKEKVIPTLIGIIVIVVVAVIAFGGVFVYQYFTIKNNFGKNISADIDAACDGKKDPYYIIGFGVEHTYEGDIKPGMHAKIVLSCDHKKITISGAVDQIIRASDLARYTGVESADLADLSGGDLVVGVDSDYNFDGYKDLSSINSNGQGVSGMKSYFIFLYDPKSNNFVYNNGVSSLENITTNESKKEIYQEFCFYKNDELICNKIYYKWSDDRLLKVN